ncbi:hypothetical protein Q7404_07470 [Glaesserella parasuis]|nr:hypothetical protein [Glaesserella parasuis]
MTTLTFQNTTLSVINKNNHTFLTSKDLGLALAYKNPTSDIMRIYDRNADEFTAEMTALIELQTAGGKQQVRVFSLRWSSPHRNVRPHQSRQRVPQMGTRHSRP